MATSFPQNASKEDNDEVSNSDCCTNSENVCSDMKKQKSPQNMVFCTEDRYFNGDLSHDSVATATKVANYDFLELPKNSIIDGQSGLVVPMSTENTTVSKEFEGSGKELKKFTGELQYATKKMTAKFRDRKNNLCPTAIQKSKLKITEGKTCDMFSDQEDSFQHSSVRTNQNVCEDTKSDSEGDHLMNVDDSDPITDSSVEPPTLKKAKSASDFLQKLVQEQKSQVPTLFCRELPALHSASKLYNTDFKLPCAKISLFGVPKCSSDPMFVGSLNTQQSNVLVSVAKNPLICSEESNNAKNSINSKKPTAQYDSISSDDEDKSYEKPKDISFSPNEAATRSITSESTAFTDCSGKLRFYLDGRFVLELTHSAGSKGNSKGWVQSKGKIWRPTSQVTGRLTRTPCKKTISESSHPQAAHTSFVNFLTSSNSLNSPFMLHANKQTRVTCLCWLSKKDLRHGARNPLVDLHEIYQTALRRNQPVLSPSTISFSKLRGNSKRKKVSLNGIWKLIQKHKSNSGDMFSLSNEQANGESAEQADDSVNSSLLLNALTKPKGKESKWLDIPCETRETMLRSPSLTQSNETSKVSQARSPDISLSKTVVTASKGTNCHLICEKEVTSLNASGLGKKDDVVESVPNVNKTESCSLSSLLPLPEWYLDPSKAEVPISEMIGYPRPYFPPASNETRTDLVIKKRHSSQTKCPITLIKKKFYFKDDMYRSRTMTAGETSEANEVKPSDNWLMWVPKVEQNIDAVSTATTHKHSLVNDDFKDAEQIDHQMLTNVYDQSSKLRCAKRFGSYGRGHAVNEAIRTFVISDIVNLGGDLESRYVPRGVYSEVASRYKIDVSTTTRWWLRYCADYEHLSKKNVPPSLINKEINLQMERYQKSETCTSKLESLDEAKNLSDPYINPEQRKGSHFYGSRIISSRDENCFKNCTAIPKTESKRNLDQPLEFENQMEEDMPLDLRVKRNKIDENAIEKLPYLLDVKHIHQSASVVTHSVPLNILQETDRTVFNSESVNRKENKNLSLTQMSNSKMSCSGSFNNSMTMPVFTKSWEGQIEPCENSKLLNTSHHPPYSENPVSSRGNGVNKSGFNLISPSYVSELNDADDSHSTESMSKNSEMPLCSSVEYPLQNSALKPLTSISSYHCVSRAQDQIVSQTQSDILQNESSRNSSPKQKNSICPHDSNLSKPPCIGLNHVNKSVLPECPSYGVPLSSLHGDYARLGPPAPPPIALGPWPYAPCPLMTYGPTLVNSYYYCCCFLPGCRFHYIYGPDGQPVESEDSLTASPSLLLANGYSKYCPPVAEISPVIFESIHQDHMYKSWHSTVAESGAENNSPVKSSSKEEHDIPKTESDISVSQNSESSGSMLKDLLLKPSRGTPERLNNSPKQLPLYSESILNSRPNSVDHVLLNKSNAQINSTANLINDNEPVAIVNHTSVPTHSRCTKMEVENIESIEQRNNIHENIMAKNGISEIVDINEPYVESKSDTSDILSSPKLINESERPS